jgi:hypothetical protein
MASRRIEYMHKDIKYILYMTQSKNGLDISITKYYTDTYTYAVIHLIIDSDFGIGICTKLVFDSYFRIILLIYVDSYYVYQCNNKTIKNH